MKKIVLTLFSISLLFLIGCSSIEKDNRVRISGIIVACKASPQLRKDYLVQKVNNEQISQLVAYTIQECLKDE